MPTLPTFHERLKNLHEDSGLTQIEFAKQMDVSSQTMSYIMNGREPKYDLLVKMAKHFGVSTDYLLGASDNKAPENKNIKDILGLSDDAIMSLRQNNAWCKDLQKATKEPDKKEFYSQFMPTVSKFLSSFNFRMFFSLMTSYVAPNIRKRDMEVFISNLMGQRSFDDPNMYHEYMRSNIKKQLDKVLDDVCNRGDSDGEHNKP